MTALFEDDFDVQDPVEVHWSSSTILAVFFAASLVSAVFFGLGYSFGGEGTVQHSLSFSSAPVNTSAAEPNVATAKPTPVATSIQPSPISNLAASGDGRAAMNVASAPPVALRAVAMTTAARTDEPVAEKKSAPSPSVQHESALASQKSSAHIMVQVGAIGNRKDADRLLAELRKKGFHAGIYTEKHDKFLHVQIGPYKDAAQAQSKRHQVMASGFHAILKSS